MAENRESSWALAPARDLHVLEKEDVPDHVLDGVTFRPDLVSNPELRQRARSSGYGREAVVQTKVVLEDDEIRPWHEVPTFRPELPEDPKRKSASGSGYGKVLPVVTPKTPERPSFKPEVKRTQSAQKMLQRTASSGYGRVTAQSPRPKSAPETPSFRPRLSKTSRLRSEVKSSGYGKVLPPRKESIGTPEPKSPYLPRYTLLMDRPEPKAAEPDERESAFVLDGVASSTQNRLYTPVEKPKLSAKQRELLDKAPSSAYGINSPPVTPRREPAPAPRSFKLDRSSVLDEPLEPFATKTPLADKVRSSNYRNYRPEVKPRKERPASESQWALASKGAWSDQVEPVPRSHLNDQVQSHGYGSVSPAKGPRYEVAAKPLWLPNNKAHKMTPPAPIPRSRLNDQVQSHYGKTYDPSALYAFNGDEEFDDEIAHGSRRINGASHNASYENGTGVDEEEDDIEAY